MLKGKFFYLMIGLALAALSFRTERSDVKTNSYIGYAYEVGSHDLIYTEEFTDTFVNGRQMETRTCYFDRSHKQIAVRKLDFTLSLFAPRFRMEDLRTGYLEGAEANGNKVNVFVREDKNSPQQEKTLSVPEPVVIDGGFNQFIKANWSKLEKGQPVVFNFVVPAKLDHYTLCATAVDITRTTMKVKIELDKTLLRWLTAPIIIDYDTETKRILSYQGKSNISDEEGNNFVARLIYPDKGP